MPMHVSISRSFFPALLVAISILNSSGCGGGEKVVSVSGTVTHNGQPVPGIVVSFVPSATTETGVSTGETDESGNYKLKVAKTGSSGAVVGKHKVWISIPREAPNPDDKEARAGKSKVKATTPASKARPELAPILKVYGNLEKTPLTVEVKGGESIDLKLD